MDLKTLATEEALVAVSAMESVEELREAATQLGLTYSGNTGANTLKTKITDFYKDMPLIDDTPTELKEPVVEEVVLSNQSASDILGNSEPLPEIIQQPKVKLPPTIPELLLMNVQDVDPKNQTLIRQIVRAKALRLSRVKITNLDPNDSQLSGGIVTVLNKYTGRVSKYIPYGEESENGYHVEEILLNHLRGQKFALRREIKGGQFGVKRYRTTLVSKYSIVVLEDLTKKELNDLADTQRSTLAID